MISTETGASPTPSSKKRRLPPTTPQETLRNGASPDLCLLNARDYLYIHVYIDDLTGAAGCDRVIPRRRRSRASSLMTLPPLRSDANPRRLIVDFAYTGHGQLTVVAIRRCGLSAFLAPSQASARWAPRS